MPPTSGRQGGNLPCSLESEWRLRGVDAAPSRVPGCVSGAGAGEKSSKKARGIRVWPWSPWESPLLAESTLMGKTLGTRSPKAFLNLAFGAPSCNNSFLAICQASLALSCFYLGISFLSQTLANKILPRLINLVCWNQ